MYPPLRRSEDGRPHLAGVCTPSLTSSFPSSSSSSPLVIFDLLFFLATLEEPPKPAVDTDREDDEKEGPNDQIPEL